MRSLLLFVVAVPSFAQVSITIQPADHAAIPGSSRSVYATVQGTQNLGVKWSADGGCTLASPITNVSPQIVTAPAQGGVCKFSGMAPTNEAPSFRSPVSCTIKAASAADQTKSASIVIPVCAPPVTLSTFPRSTVLYINQLAVIQSNIRGSVITGVTWAITANPKGGGILIDAVTNRHAIFSAKAAGIYTLTATSVADRSKTSSTTIYVTSNELPAPTSDHTEPVDCTPVGNGKTYEVGPARAFHDLNAIAWNSLRPGDTVRIHNDDATGASPTIYRQRVSLAATGSATQPIRICGVPDARGAKPIVDAENSTTRPDENFAKGLLDGGGIFTIYDAAHKFDTAADGSRNILIEGLHIRNATLSTSYIPQAGGPPALYGRGGVGVRVQTGNEVLIRGNEFDKCTQAVFTNSQTPGGGIVYDLTVEGNYIHGWGTPRVDRQHGLYLQGIGLVVQFNYFGAADPETPGNVIKTRSVGNFLRWNYISQSAGTARAFDLIEPQAFGCYVIPYEFSFAYHGGKVGTDCGSPRGGSAQDPFSADMVAGTYEAYRADYIYGNILDDFGAGPPFVHYSYDIQTAAGPGQDRRAGTLFYWNNTHLIHKLGRVKAVFDTYSPGGGKSYEYPSIQSVNNVFGADGAKYLWTLAFIVQIRVDSNWMTPPYLLPYRNAPDSFQGATSAAEFATCDAYGSCKPGNGRMTWFRGGKPGTVASTLYVGPTPFDMKTYVPSPQLRGLSAALPAGIRDQPSNMEYLPATNTIKHRHDLTSLGALD